MSKKRLPPDWDKPSGDNAKWFGRFKSFRVAEKKMQLQIWTYKPVITKKKLPLVVYLHGADGHGQEGEHLMMHDIGTMFVRDDIQKKYPCYVFAPQCSLGQHWGSEETVGFFVRCLKAFISDCKNVDNDRIYIYGYSAGGAGVLNLIKNLPGFFAGAVCICPATNSDGIESLSETPIWLIHAQDDEIIKESYGKGSNHLGTKELYELSVRSGWKHMHYTMLPAGYMKERYGVNPHCSWVYMSDSSHDEFTRWLFGLRRESAFGSIPSEQQL